MRLIDIKEETVPQPIPADRIVGRQLRFSALHYFPLGFGDALKFMVIERLQSEGFMLNTDFWRRFVTIGKETQPWVEKFPRKGRLGAIGLKEQVHLGDLPIFAWNNAGFVHKVGKYYVWYMLKERLYLVFDSNPEEMDLYFFMDRDNPFHLELLELETRGEGSYALKQIGDDLARLIAKSSKISPSNGPTLCI
jgi:hypothetical protein